jgi:hypothetical protein
MVSDREANAVSTVNEQSWKPVHRTEAIRMRKQLTRTLLIVGAAVFVIAQTAPRVVLIHSV